MPVTFAPAIAVKPAPLPINKLPEILPVAEIKPTVRMLPLSTLPVTLADAKIPTLVIFGCAFVVTVPAVVALVANPTAPITLLPVS